MWEKNGDKMQQEVPELWRTLLAAAKDKDAHDITCVVDALDECRPSDRQRLINMLARFHANSQHKGDCDARLKILVTSRPYNDIELDFARTLRDLPTIRLQGEEKNDEISDEINAVVRERVAGLAHELRLKEPVRARLEAKLLGMEHRTYLWLHLALESFSTTLQNSLWSEDEPFEMLPSTVDDAYEKMLNRIAKDQRDVVRKTLQIVVGCRRALTVPEMAIALGIATKQVTTQSSLDSVRLDSELLKRKLSQWCGLFLFINHDRIYLIHLTAKEFLLSDDRASDAVPEWKQCLDVRKTEEQMCRLCVSFLTLEDVCITTRDLSQRVSQFRVIDEALVEDDPVESLVVYAAEYWVSHLQAGIFVPDAIMADLLFQFYDTTRKKQPPWFAVYWKATRPYGSQPDVTALQLAAILGHERALANFMGHGFRPGVDDCDNAGRTALFWACDSEHKGIVQMLLEKGANVNTRCGRYGDALQTASKNGHHGIVEILLEKGAEVNAQGGSYGNALQAASYRGHDMVVQILLERGAEVNAQGGSYGNALQAALSGGNNEIVELLLEKGADVHAQGGSYGNALQAASSGENKEIVELLLEKGTDVNTQGGHFSNALQAASSGGNKEIVELLLQRGADVNAQGGRFGETSLSWVAVRGLNDAVEILLTIGNADPNMGDDCGQTPLSGAAIGGHEPTVKLLLDVDNVHADAVDDSGRTPLLWAAEGGHLAVVKMLTVREDVDIGVEDACGLTALQLAFFNHHEDVETLLLECGAPVAADFFGLQALLDDGDGEEV